MVKSQLSLARRDASIEQHDGIPEWPWHRLPHLLHRVRVKIVLLLP